jgi:hypothetical protein
VRGKSICWICSARSSSTWAARSRPTHPAISARIRRSLPSSSGGTLSTRHRDPVGVDEVHRCGLHGEDFPGDAHHTVVAFLPGVSRICRACRASSRPASADDVCVGIALRVSGRHTAAPRRTSVPPFEHVRLSCRRSSAPRRTGRGERQRVHSAYGRLVVGTVLHGHHSARRSTARPCTGRLRRFPVHPDARPAMGVFALREVVQVGSVMVGRFRSIVPPGDAVPRLIRRPSRVNRWVGPPELRLAVMAPRAR